MVLFSSLSSTGSMTSSPGQLAPSEVSAQSQVTAVEVGPSFDHCASPPTSDSEHADSRSSVGSILDIEISKLGYTHFLMK